MKENIRFATVAETAYMNQAEFIKSVIEEAGYEAFIFDESSCNMYPLVLEGSIKVKVDENLVTEIKQFLNDNECEEYVVDY